MDIEYYYLSIFVMSVLALLVYIWRTGRNSDIYFTLIFVLIPIANIGYIPLYLSENVNEALLGNKIVYMPHIDQLIFPFFRIDLFNIKGGYGKICMIVVANLAVR